MMHVHPHAALADTLPFVMRTPRRARRVAQIWHSVTWPGRSPEACEILHEALPRKRLYPVLCHFAAAAQHHDRPPGPTNESDEAGAALVRLSGQLVDEAHGFGEGIIVGVLAEAGHKVGIECGSLVTENRGGEEGRRPDEPG